MIAFVVQLVILLILANTEHVDLYTKPIVLIGAKNYYKQDNVN